MKLEAKGMTLKRSRSIKASRADRQAMLLPLS
jgi:hypothetical protein